ncbi:MAG: SET domain-containing protein-lysine N-methyltransferase [Cyclobacteriaceae bacterium]|jgi:hypothetical protein|nr:SET domain-containing protein-lysine N-methyltransferase [Cytophagales bacterium]HNP78589.1 SET domain-containing protein-lysine N-methyltransferase [Cyclobacteriaceae bacterium]HQQ84124.1 SET domain-containing protein-lysine N-methyltransferase [Cyclobacteriaceae bacterium]
MGLTASNKVSIEYSSEVAEKRTDVRQGIRSLWSRRDFQPGDVIAEFTWDMIHPKPNYLTVQIGEGQHILLRPEYLECINHSCDPNCFFDTTRKVLVAVRAIQEGDEFSFFYPSAEWNMDQAFQCLCGSPRCIGMIKGAKYLSPELVRQYQFTDFIQQKLKENGQL